MDSGSIALILVLLFIATYSMQQAKQKGIVFKKWQIALLIILGIIMGLAPVAYLIWKFDPTQMTVNF